MIEIIVQLYSIFSTNKSFFFVLHKINIYDFQCLLFDLLYKESHFCIVFYFQGAYGVENNLADVFFLTPKQYAATVENKNERFWQPRGSTLSSGTNRSKHSITSKALRAALSQAGRVEGNRIVKPLHKRTDKRIRKKYMGKPQVTYNKQLQQFIRSYSVA